MLLFNQLNELFMKASMQLMYIYGEFIKATVINML